MALRHLRMHQPACRIIDKHQQGALRLNAEHRLKRVVRYPFRPTLSRTSNPANAGLSDILQIAGLLGIILRPIEARYNEIRLAADCAGSRIVGLAVSKRWN